MQACSLCASLPRTQSLERESARILQAGPASPGAAPRGPASLAERSELPGIVWVNSSTSGGGRSWTSAPKCEACSVETFRSPWTTVCSSLKLACTSLRGTLRLRGAPTGTNFTSVWWARRSMSVASGQLFGTAYLKRKFPCRGNRRASSATAVQTSLRASADRRLRPSHSPDSSNSSSDEVCLPYTGPLLQIFFLYLVLNPDQTDSGTGPAGRKVHNVTLPSRFPTRVATRRAGRNQAWVCGAGGRRVVRLAPPFCR